MYVCMYLMKWVYKGMNDKMILYSLNCLTQLWVQFYAGMWGFTEALEIKSNQIGALRCFLVLHKYAVQCAAWRH